MAKTTFLISAITFVVSATVGWVSVAPAPLLLTKAKRPAHRAPAMAKGSGLFQVSIRSVGGPLDLEATITAHMGVEDAKFTWILPEGVEALSPISGSLGRMDEGQTQSLSFSAASDVEDNQRIHLHVYQLQGYEAQGKMAQYNSAPAEPSEPAVRAVQSKLKVQSHDHAPERRIMQ